MFPKFLDGYLKFILKRKKTVIGILLFITLFFSAGLNRLYFYNKFTSWLDKKDEVARLFIELSEKFSINELIVVVCQMPDGVFQEKNLKRIEDFSRALQEQEEIFAVNSLSTMVDISRDEDEGVVVQDLLTVAQKMSPQEFARYVLSRELYRNQIISADGQYAMISVFVRGDRDSEKVLKQKVIPLSKKYLQGSEGGNIRLFYSGIPANAYFLNGYSLQDLQLLSPLIFVLIALILLLSFRRLRGVVYPLLVVLLATIWTFGLIGYSGKPLTFVTAIIPVLLVALGSAYGIHLVNRFRFLQANCADRVEEVQKAVKDVFVPILLAGLTTFIGFLSFFSAGLSLIANFGIFSACGIVFALIISLSLLPVLEVIFYPQKACVEIKNSWQNHSSFGLGKFVIKHHRAIFFFCSLLMIISIIFIGRIIREANFSEYFPKSSLAYQGNKVVEKNFQGAMPVIFDFQSKSMKSAESLRLLRKTENFLIGYRKLSKPLSISTLIAELNWQLNERYALPDRNAAIDNLWFFVEGRKELEQISSPDLKETLVFARFSDPRTRAQRELQSYLKLFLNELQKGVYSFEIDNLSAEQREKIGQFELTALSKELFWLLEGYGQEVSFEEVYSILEKFAWNARHGFFNADQAIKTIDNYFQSAEFELEIAPEIKSSLLERFKSAFAEGIPRKEAFLEMVLKDYGKHLAKQQEEVVSLIDTLLFKVADDQEKRLVNDFLKNYEHFFKASSGELTKRASAILYDLLDNLAILVAPPEMIRNFGTKIELQARLSGFPALMMQLDKSLFNSQLQSIILAYSLTLILMMLIYRKLLLGFVATTPIIFTVAIVYGFLGIAGIPLDYATMLTGAVAIGVGIDYAIHLLYAAFQRRQQGIELERALIEAIDEKAGAILTNAVSVLAGFAVLLFSAMLILRNFGGTMIAAMVLAAFAALFYLPSILLMFSRRLKI